MLTWIKNAVGSIAGWMGDGVASLFDWLLGGIATVVTKAVDAMSGFWDVLDAIWNFAIGFLDAVLALFFAFFPFVPEPVTAALGFGLLAILLAGIIKKVRGK